MRAGLEPWRNAICARKSSAVKQESAKRKEFKKTNRTTNIVRISTVDYTRKRSNLERSNFCSVVEDEGKGVVPLVDVERKRDGPWAVCDGFYVNFSYKDKSL